MAETPPPFNPNTGQPRKTGTNPLIWVLVALAAFCCICSVGGYFTINSGIKEVQKESKCFMTLGLAQASIKEYVEENGVFPSAENWQEEISPYYNKSKDETTEGIDEAPGPMKGLVEGFLDFQDISKPLSCHEGNPVTGIAYNSNLAGKTTEDFAEGELDKTVVVFENDTVNLNNSSPYREKQENPQIKVFNESREYYKITWDDDMNFENSNASFTID